MVRVLAGMRLPRVGLWVCLFVCVSAPSCFTLAEIDAT